MTPARLLKPTVGLMPAMPHAPDGFTIEPSVSVPSAAAARFALTAAPEPELEPPGLRSGSKGFRHWPPRPLQPLVDLVERKLAHSLRLALPRITAPASRSAAATVASRAGRDPSRASEPAVVCMRSAVSILSFNKMGMPCSGPRTRPAARSESSRAAIASASGLVSITERRMSSSAAIAAR